MPLYTYPDSLTGVWVGQVSRFDYRMRLQLGLAGESVAAGFPSPAEEYLEKTLDLNEYLVPRPEATFFVRVSGDSMIGASIHHGDILVVDRSQTPRPGNVIIALVDGEFTVKRLRKTPTGLELAPENPDFTPIPLSEETEFQVWGVVLHVVHKV
ncbi:MULTISPECIES: translesion error-prone DNA polymerase V autoproteolytic subunit [unclassified Pseudodesulfovibrio]|uniref:LexA family protein n=2 Tax=unclassified Pseudodesulfovibrio TaxID=2661612 RepID=UPI000FEB6DE6|nr:MULTISPECIES: translesion error-prone DNA polymerase V autoproteolytic subunit [unclassified Pseudodesulfovibrio]MCJ2165525.1 translesion error-prone DNA polymerase V autoproteolytic subunit [Pseudodesulfovibrio sp. S3-i]RWU03113.1 peptidase S24 [Pseudodesulfovibrio sp. S3]